MRLLCVMAVLALLLFGCVQQPGATPQPNATPQPPPQANNTPPAQPNQTVYSGNITQSPPPQVPSPVNQTNQTNQTNQSAPQENQTPPLAPGLPFPDSNYSLYLDDVSIVPSSQSPCGIFSVRDQNRTIIDKLLICPPESQDWVSPQGHDYRIRVDQVAAGYTHQAAWAKVEIFG